MKPASLNPTIERTLNSYFFIFAENLNGYLNELLLEVNMFTTYEDRTNPHISIHRNNCNQLRKRGGRHKDGKIHYKQHNSYVAANAYADSINLPKKVCSFCKPQERA